MSKAFETSKLDIAKGSTAMPKVECPTGLPKLEDPAKTPNFEVPLVSVLQNKGGVGKTTCIINLAAILK